MIYKLTIYIFYLTFLSACSTANIDNINTKTASSFSKKAALPIAIKNEIKKLNTEFPGTRYSHNGKLYALYNRIKNNGFMLRIWDIQSARLKYKIVSQNPDSSL